jgi:iron complex transport system ATP-binding protein
VIEIVLMGRYPHLGPLEFEGPKDMASAHAALAATGTDHLASRAFATLSGGERQRVVIASALAQLGEGTTDAHVEGRALLLDEPTAALDLRYQIEVAALLTRLHDRQDITIVLTTHDVHFAARVCSQLILLSDGAVLAQGTPEEVLTTERIASLYNIDTAHAEPFAIGHRR